MGAVNRMRSRFSLAASKALGPCSGMMEGFNKARSQLGSLRVGPWLVGHV